MVANIDALLERGERLDLLVDKTEHLSAHSVTFKQTSRNLARKMWWQNTR
jgi:vesicle-associated membrane protein 7